MTSRKIPAAAPRPLAILGGLLVLALASAAVSTPVADEPAPAPRERFASRWPDALTENCLGCHSDARSRFVATRLAGTPSAYVGHRSLDHPIGMPYGEYASRFPASYRRTSSLDPSIRLIDGKVVCVSCHRLKSAALATHSAALGGERGECLASQELARDPYQNSLCLACHLL